MGGEDGFGDVIVMGEIPDVGDGDEPREEAQSVAVIMVCETEGILGRLFADQMLERVVIVLHPPAYGAAIVEGRNAHHIGGCF